MNQNAGICSYMQINKLNHTKSTIALVHSSKSTANKNKKAQQSLIITLIIILSSLVYSSGQCAVFLPTNFISVSNNLPHTRIFKSPIFTLLMGNDSNHCCQNFQSQTLYEISNSIKWNLFTHSPFYQIVYHETKIVYKGQLKNNIPHGKGTQIHPDGDVYEGNFDDGFKEGLGTYCFADGSKYQGTFVKNAMEGRGVMMFANGDVYEGEFKQNTMEGFGIYKCKAEDSEYRGYYLKGAKHGEGKILFNGVLHKGMWENGVFYFV